MRSRRLLAAATLVAASALGGVAVAAASTDGSAGSTGSAASGGSGGSASGPAATAPGSARCARLVERVAEVPGIRDRIAERLEAIDTRIAAVRSPVLRDRLRERLTPRIDALQALDERLAEQVAQVEARCPTPA